MCSYCKGDGTRCSCHKSWKPKSYETSAKDKLLKERLDLRTKWRKLGVNPTFIDIDDY